MNQSLKCYECDGPATVKLTFNPGTGGMYVKCFCRYHTLEVVPRYRGCPVIVSQIEQENLTGRHNHDDGRNIPAIYRG